MTDESWSDTSWIVDFENLSAAEAEARALAQGRMVRVLRPGDAMTLDLRPQRLNIFLDDSGRLDRVSAG